MLFNVGPSDLLKSLDGREWLFRSRFSENRFMDLTSNEHQTFPVGSLSFPAFSGTEHEHIIKLFL